jgi:hypothetical protein
VGLSRALFYMHVGGNTSGAPPAVHAKIKVAWVYDGEVRIRGREDRFCLCVKLRKQSTRWSRGEWQVPFFAGPGATIGDHASVNMGSISRLQSSPASFQT